MRYLLNYLKGQLESGKDAILVSVIANSGSIPRGAGARMLVSEEGGVYGNLGGGYVAHDAESIAIKALKEKKTFIKDYSLSPAEIGDLGLITDGEVMLHFQYIEGDSEYAITLCDQALALFNKEEPLWLITDVAAEGSFATAIYAKSTGLWGMELPPDLVEQLCRGRAVYLTAGDRRYYGEPLVRSGYVYIFGGSQIAQELTPLLTTIGFRCIVYDDRKEFAKSQLFPGARAVILGSFADIDTKVSISRDDFVVIATRGHQGDYDVLKQVLATEACYIGVSITEKDGNAIARRLGDEGFPFDQSGRLCVPMGLPIKAETPEEIAVGIAAEMILKRAERAGC